MRKRIAVLLLSILSNVGIASNDVLNNTLVRVINQLNATLPLLDEAGQEVNPNTRIKLHIEAFEGADGQQHPGVRTDILSIRNALIDYINRPAIEPKTVKPLVFDFVGK